MGVENITVFAAFFAGLLSFISPCVLPLIPVYLGYLSGSTITGDEPPSRKLVFTHALLFVGGFTLVFVTFGAFAGLLGSVLFTLTDYMVWIGGILLIIFGLHVMGVITIPIFNQQKRMEYGQGQTPSYVRSGLIGMTFAAGWTPCIGPILGVILTLGLSSQNVGLAAFYLFVYSMGFGYTFLGNGLAVDSSYQPAQKAQSLHAGHRAGQRRIHYHRWRPAGHRLFYLPQHRLQPVHA